MIIVDFSQILFANIFMDDSVSSCAKNPSEQNKNMLIHFGLNSLRSINNLHKERFGKLVVACDSGSWRYGAFPHYKWSRKQKRLNDDSGIDWNFVSEVNAELISIIDTKIPFTLLKVNGAEADDINGILVNHLLMQENAEDVFGMSEPEPIVICSTDKDNYQLLKHKHVRQYSLRDKKFVKPAGSARDALIEKIVKGDSGDGIPNIRSASDVFVTGTRQKPISSKYLEAIQKAKDPISACNPEDVDNYIRNEMLVSYEKTPEVIYNSVIEQYNEKIAIPASKMGLMNFFIERRMNNLMSNIQDFF